MNIFVNKINQSGFSILEVVLALGIISIGLLGVSSLVIQNLQVQNINRDYLIASMLAQEGLELVRNIRDENWLIGPVTVPWDTDITTNCDGTFIVNYNGTVDCDPDDIDDPSPDETRLYLHNGFYIHNSAGTPTQFYRLISATKPDDHIIEVSSTVRWRERGRTHDYVAETHLYNWR